VPLETGCQTWPYRVTPAATIIRNPIVDFTNSVKAARIKPFPRASWVDFCPTWDQATPYSPGTTGEANEGLEPGEGFWDRNCENAQAACADRPRPRPLCLLLRCPQ
jgi:hypothetical protein